MIDVQNPRTGLCDYRITPPTPAEIANTCAGLRTAQKAWQALSFRERANILSEFADLLQKNRRTIAAALTEDTGRAALSGLEVDAMVGLAQRWAREGPAMVKQLQEPPRPSNVPGIHSKGRLIPYPLVGVISPWNFPLILSLLDAFPALLAGSAVIVKPSEITPRFSQPLSETIGQLSPLNSVLAVVSGDGATGASIVEQVDYLAFTGSVATGKKVAQATAAAMIPASLELGGKDPAIVLASADADLAAETLLRASIANNGQACQSIERIYVERPLAEDFLQSLIEKAQKIRFNYPDIHQGELGPFIDQRQAAIVAGQLDDARAQGAIIHCGGTVENLGGGLYLAPTVLTNVTPTMRLMTDETFGPVLPVTIVDSVDDAVALANDSQFGLSASVMAGDFAAAEKVAARLNCGAISINDAGLTTMVWDREKTSFGLSGLGPSRMGSSSINRYFRRQALLCQTASPMPVSILAEDL